MPVETGRTSANHQRAKGVPLLLGVRSAAARTYEKSSSSLNTCGARVADRYHQSMQVLSTKNDPGTFFGNSPSGVYRLRFSPLLPQSHSWRATVAVQSGVGHSRRWQPGPLTPASSRGEGVPFFKSIAAGNKKLPLPAGRGYGVSGSQASRSCFQSDRVAFSTAQGGMPIEVLRSRHVRNDSACPRERGHAPCCPRLYNFESL